MQHTVPFSFAGQDWEANVDELPQTIEMDLENVIQEGTNYRAEGTAKLMVIRESVKSLYRVTSSGKKPQTLRDSKGNLKLPDVRDPETRQGIKESLLKAAVGVNDFLGYVDPFKGVFEGYLPGDDGDGDAGENPTAPEAISRNASVSGSEVASIQPSQTTPGGTANES